MRSYLPIALLAATLLGIFNQQIAYFIHDNILDIAPIYYVTACTTISIVLFVAMLITLFVKKQALAKGIWMIYVVITCVLMFLVSGFSAFVTLMWWG